LYQLKAATGLEEGCHEPGGRSPLTNRKVTIVLRKGSMGLEVGPHGSGGRPALTWKKAIMDSEEGRI
jgi:hypothetical protein